MCTSGDLHNPGPGRHLLLCFLYPHFSLVPAAAASTGRSLSVVSVTRARVQGDLLSPCECAGSLRTVHRACLERWLSSSNGSRCELCHFEFALEHLPKPLTEWLTAPAMQHQRRALCGDALCFLIITPLASLSGWLCVQGAMDLYNSSSKEAFGLLVLTLALFIIYLFWTLVSLRYHVHLFRVWRASDPRVRLHVAPPGHTSRRDPSTPPYLDTAKTKDAVV